MVSVAYGQGRIQEDRKMGIHLPIAIFKHVFDVYNFSIISNFCDSNKPLRTHNRKCANKMHHIWQNTHNQGQKFIQNLCENYSKSPIIDFTACKFFKFFSGNMPQDPLEHFLFLNQLQIRSAKKKKTLKKV